VFGLDDDPLVAHAAGSVTKDAVQREIPRPRSGALVCMSHWTFSRSGSFEAGRVAGALSSPRSPYPAAAGYGGPSPGVLVIPSLPVRFDLRAADLATCGNPMFDQFRRDYERRLTTACARVHCCPVVAPRLRRQIGRFAAHTASARTHPPGTGRRTGLLDRARRRPGPT
jgi:hypothetical protein